jgi:hypothetical protein
MDIIKKTTINTGLGAGTKDPSYPVGENVN